MLLMTLEYFYMSQSYNISESTAYKTIRWVEDRAPLARKRVLNENASSMLADCYKNRRKRFGLRFNLISGIYKFGVMLWVLKEL